MATLNLEKGFESDVEEISSARLEESAQPIKYLNCKHEDVRPTSEHRFKKTKTNIYILDVVVWETGAINQHWAGGQNQANVWDSLASPLATSRQGRPYP